MYLAIRIVSFYIFFLAKVHSIFILIWRCHTVSFLIWVKAPKQIIEMFVSTACCSI